MNYSGLKPSSSGHAEMSIKPDDTVTTVSRFVLPAFLVGFIALFVQLNRRFQLDVFSDSPYERTITTCNICLLMFLMVIDKGYARVGKYVLFYRDNILYFYIGCSFLSWVVFYDGFSTEAVVVPSVIFLFDYYKKTLVDMHLCETNEIDMYVAFASLVIPDDEKNTDEYREFLKNAENASEILGRKRSKSTKRAEKRSQDASLGVLIGLVMSIAKADNFIPSIGNVLLDVTLVQFLSVLYYALKLDYVVTWRSAVWLVLTTSFTIVIHLIVFLFAIILTWKATLFSFLTLASWKSLSTGAAINVCLFSLVHATSGASVEPVHKMYVFSWLQTMVMAFIMFLTVIFLDKEKSPSRIVKKVVSVFFDEDVKIRKPTVRVPYAGYSEHGEQAMTEVFAEHLEGESTETSLSIGKVSELVSVCCEKTTDQIPFPNWNLLVRRAQSECVRLREKFADVREHKTSTFSMTASVVTSWTELIFIPYHIVADYIKTRYDDVGHDGMCHWSDFIMERNSPTRVILRFGNMLCSWSASCDIEDPVKKLVSRGTALYSFADASLGKEEIVQLMTAVKEVGMSFPTMSQHLATHEVVEDPVFSSMSTMFDDFMESGDMSSNLKTLLGVIFAAPIVMKLATKKTPLTAIITEISNSVRQHSGVTDLLIGITKFVYSMFSTILPEDEKLRLVHESWVKAYPCGERYITGFGPYDLTMMRQLVADSIAMHEEAIKTFKKVSVVKILSDRVCVLYHILDGISFKLGSFKLRREPFVTTLVGESGAGKSSTITVLDQIAAKNDGIEHRKPASVQGDAKFANTIDNMTTSVMFDDFCNFKIDIVPDPTAGAFQIFWATTGPVPVPLDKADVESKGKTQFNGFSVYVASNSMTFNADKIATMPDALLRRFGAMYEVRIDPSVKSDPKGGLIMNRNLDFSTLPSDSKSVLPDWRQFRTYELFFNDGHLSTRVGDWMTGDQFLTEWADKREKWFIGADRALKRVGKELEFCGSCKRPLSICRCKNEDFDFTRSLKTAAFNMALSGTFGSLTVSQEIWVRQLMFLETWNLSSFRVFQVIFVVTLVLHVCQLCDFTWIRFLFLLIPMVYVWFLEQAIYRILRTVHLDLRERVSQSGRRLMDALRTYAPVLALLSVVFLMFKAVRTYQKRLAKKHMECTLEGLYMSLKSQDSRWELVPRKPSDRYNVQQADEHAKMFVTDLVKVLEKDAFEEGKRKPITATVMQGSITSSDLSKLCARNTYVLELRTGESNELAFRGNIFFICNGLAVVNRHFYNAILGENAIFDMSKDVSTFTAHVHKSHFHEVDSTDLVLACVNIPDIPRDLRPYLSDEIVKRSTGIMVRRDIDTKGLRDFQVSLSGLSKYDTNAGNRFIGYKYLISGGSRAGFCGAPVVSTENGQTAIRGIHAFGLDGSDEAGCAVLTLKDAMRALEKFSIMSPASFPLGEIKSDKKTVPHEKSLAKNLGDLQTTVVGTDSSNNTPIPTLRIDSYAPRFEGAFGRKLLKAPVKMKQSDHKTQISFACGDIHQYPLDSARLAIDDYLRDIDSLIILAKKNPMFKTSVLNLSEAISGVTGNCTLKGLNLNTSTGWPHFTKKKNFFSLDDDGSLLIEDEMAEGIRDVCRQINRGYTPTEPYTVALKSESRPLAKVDQPRQFYVCSAAVLIISATVIDPIQQLFSMFPNEFETFGGVDPLSPDSDRLYARLSKYGLDRCIAGDFKKMDKRLGHEAKTLCREIYVRIGLALGYTTEEIKLLKIIFDTMIMPLIMVQGTTIIVPNLNTSGDKATTIKNGPAGFSLDLRIWAEEDFGLLSKLAKEGRQFRDICSIVTQGDDHVAALSDEAPSEMTNQWYAIKQARFGRVYTTPSKDFEFVDYYNLHEVSFCQRVWKFNVDDGRWYLVFDPDNFLESLSMYDKKLSREERNNRYLEILQAMRLEAIPHGRLVYHKYQEVIEDVLEIVQLAPTVQLREDYDSALSSLGERGTTVTLFREDMEEDQSAETLLVDPMTMRIGAPILGEEISGDIDPLEGIAASVGTDPAEYFKRRIWFKSLKSVKTAVSSGFVTFAPIFPFSDFIIHDQVAPRLIGYTRMHGEIELEIEAVSTPGHYGEVIACLYPTEMTGRLTTLFANAPLEVKRMIATSLPHVTLTLPHQKKVVLKVPTMTRHSAIDIQAMDLTSGGCVQIIQMTDIRHFQGSDAPVTFNIYMSMPKVALFGASATMDEQARDAAKGVVSNIVTATATTASFINTVFDKYKIPVDIIEKLGTLGEVAALFGLSRPTDVQISRTIVDEIGLMSTTDTALAVHPMGVNSINQVALGPHFPFAQVDGLRITDFLGKRDYIGRATMNYNDERDTVLSRFAVNPMLGMSDGTTKYLTALAFTANMFTYWHGTILLTLKFIASPMHTGEIVISHNPLGQWAGMRNSSLANKTVVDLAVTRECVIALPWTSSEYAKKVRSPRNLLSLDSKANLSIDDNGECHLVVLTPLVSSKATGSTESIDILMYVSASSDFVFGVPRDPLVDVRLHGSYQSKLVYEPTLSLIPKQIPVDPVADNTVDPVTDKTCDKCDKINRPIAQRICYNACDVAMNPSKPFGNRRLLEGDTESDYIFTGGLPATVQGKKPRGVSVPGPFYEHRVNCGKGGVGCDTSVQTGAPIISHDMSQAPATQVGQVAETGAPSGTPTESRWSLWPTLKPVSDSTPTPTMRAEGEKTISPTTVPSKKPTEEPSNQPVSTLAPTLATCDVAMRNITDVVEVTAGVTGVLRFYLPVVGSGTLTIRVSMNVKTEGANISLTTTSTTIGNDSILSIPGDAIYTFNLDVPRAVEVTFVTIKVPGLVSVTEVEALIPHGRANVVHITPQQIVDETPVRLVDDGGVPAAYYAYPESIRSLAFNCTSGGLCSPQRLGCLVDYKGNLRANGHGMGSTVRTKRLVLIREDGSIELSLNTTGSVYIYGLTFLSRLYSEHMESGNERAKDMHLPLRVNFLGEGVASLRVLLKRHGKPVVQSGRTGFLPIYPTGLEDWQFYIYSAFYGVRGGNRVKAIITSQATTPTLVSFYHLVEGVRTTAQELVVVRGIGQIVLDFPYYCITRFENPLELKNSFVWESTSEVTIQFYYSASEDTNTVFHMGPTVVVDK